MARVAPLVAAAVLAAMTFAVALTGMAAGESALSAAPDAARQRELLAPVALTGMAAGEGALSAAPDAARQRELLALLHQDCGSCHGMRLTGGLGRALTPEKLRTQSAESLSATIVSGRPGTAMPPWRRFISDAEARWLVARMVAGDTDAPR